MNNLKYFPTFLKEIMLAFMLGFLAVGCVGTIEEGLNKETQYRDPDVGGFEYQGIIQARAIAHDKVELEFEPSFDESEYSYFLHINEGTPIKLSLESLREGQIGYLKYTLIDLERNTPYKLRVSVEKNTGEKSFRENEVIVQTFDNVVAGFNGISAVEAIPGQSHSSVRVSWVPSPIKGVLLENFDVQVYEITYIPKTTGLQYINTPGAPGRIVNTDLAVVGGPSTNPSFAIINNLEPSTSYYFQVRAIHKLYKTQKDNYDASDGRSPITVDRDMNTSWIEYRTTGTTGVYDFNQSSVEVRNADGDLGRTAVNVFWQPAQGIFHNYRVFYKKYPADGINPELDDHLEKEDIQSWLNNGVNPVGTSAGADHWGWVTAPSSATHVQISGLAPYAWYHFKVVPCKEIECKVDPASDADSSILSNRVATKIVPKLAPFYGIASVSHPQDPTKLDEIKVTFNQPVLSSGYATKMRVYCLDASMENATPFPTHGVAIAADSGVGNCDGLSYLENLNGETNLKSTTQITIKGVKNTSTSPENEASYCFAMTPIIDDRPLIAGLPPEEQPAGTINSPVQINRDSWVVRCITPEPKTPRLEEFAGLAGSCEVNKDTAKVRWNKPSGGIYNGYKLFLFRKDAGHEKFEFSTAISKLVEGDTTSQYTPSPLSGSIDPNTFEHTFTDLIGGKSYFVGVLALADAGTPEIEDDLYSEFNLNFLECKIPYPTADFKEWTRVFAVGPKTDGRVPQNLIDGPLQTSFIHEAINEEGIPYEVSRSGDYTSTGFTVINNNFTKGPGFGSPSGFTDPDFDGKPGLSGASSNTGIVSLAWKDVDLNFKGDIFKAAQDRGTRADRNFGYRIYRSSDNRANWDLLNEDLIHAGPYEYLVRSNEPSISTDMAFFTDYSVSHFSSIGTSLEIDRARVYWYKIVPVFDGVELKYSDSSAQNPHNMVKVTLPPPNMALIHRMMANRNICTEMDKSLIKNENYSCEYNGVGAVARSIPWRLGQTVYDFKHDMLVDRFELGCNFTRGDNREDVAVGNSIFNPAPSNTGFKFELKDFDGYATSGGGSNRFRGCTQGAFSNNNRTRVLASHLTQIDDLDSEYKNDEYSSLMMGDCIYNNSLSISMRACVGSGQENTDRYYFNYPQVVTAGVYNDGEEGDPEAISGANCESTELHKPGFLYGNNTVDNIGIGLFDENFVDHITIQADHAAVIYNRNSSTNSQFFAPWGPGSSDPEDTSPGKVASDIISDSFIQSCYINLAAIGAAPTTGTGNAPWKSRWIPANMLDRIKTDRGVPYDPRDTLRDFHQEPRLYTQNAVSTDDYRTPPSTMWDVRRFNENTKVGRIFSSNASKLPPLTSFSRQDAQRLCETYEVEVGFGKDEATYQKIHEPRKKRLLRKQEFTVAAAHSDDISMDNAKITQLERGADTMSGGLCVGANRIDGANGLNLVKENNARKIASNFSNPNEKTFLTTGSSEFDVRGGSYNHSALCTSRYGIQDLVGNVGEMTSDVLYCDYREDSLLYGQNNSRANSVVLDGYLEDRPDFTGYVRRIDRGYRSVFWDNAIIRQQWEDGGATFRSELNGDPKLWVQSGSDTGYCSLVDRDIARVTSGSFDIFRDPAGNFKMPTNFNGTLNTELIKILNTVDHKAVDSARNGDGFYLHWGPRGILPFLGDIKNTMALKAELVEPTSLETKKGAYFSPVLGLPLRCNSGTCDATTDNKSITTDFLKTEIVGNLPPLATFPTHNSQILHAVTGSFSESYPSINDLSSGGYQSYSVITEVIVNTPDGNPPATLDNQTNVTVVTKSVQQMIGDGQISDSVSFEKKDFDIMRHSALHFINGGGYSDFLNGRYGMRLGAEAANYNGEPARGSEYHQKSSATGIRCGIKIGEN